MISPESNYRMQEQFPFYQLLFRHNDFASCVGLSPTIAIRSNHTTQVYEFIHFLNPLSINHNPLSLFFFGRDIHLCTRNFCIFYTYRYLRTKFLGYFVDIIH